MGNLKEIVGIKSDEDFQTLVDTGTLTYGEETIEYSDDAIYFAPDEEEAVDAYTKDEVDAIKDDLQAQITGINNGFNIVDARINGIETKIPSQASATNQLADKEFVNSSISTNTATFRGTVDSVDSLPITGVDINDYAFVRATDSAGNTLYQRYKYNGSQWVFEYELNNSSFTAAQWETINSGLTANSLNDYLPLSGGTMSGDINLSTNKGFSATTTSNNVYDIFRVDSANRKLTVGGTYPSLELKGLNERPTYNGSNMALYSDIETINSKIPPSLTSLMGLKETSAWTGVTSDVGSGYIDFVISPTRKLRMVFGVVDCKDTVTFPTPFSELIWATSTSAYFGTTSVQRATIYTLSTTSMTFVAGGTGMARYEVWGYIDL